jgi:hypothetical protein
MTEEHGGPAASPPQDTPEAQAASAALKAAIEAPDFQADLERKVSGAVASVVVDQAAVKEAIAAGIKQYREESRDPFRAPLLFLAGVIAFSLALFVGLLSAWPADEMSELAAFLRTMLAWTAIVIFVATVVMFFIQAQKVVKGYKGIETLFSIFLMLVVVGFGLPSALNAFNFGYPPLPNGDHVTLYKAIERSVCDLRLLLAAPPC